MKAKAKAKPRAKKAKREEYWATGRRKEAVARLRLIPGKGEFKLNNRSLEVYFGREVLRHSVKKPLIVTRMAEKFDVVANVQGGGISGQAEAVQLGVARALTIYDETFRDSLKKEGLLTRDSREKERHKYGLKKARKAPQFSKR
ncbi:MAG: 30S ribosomal protein S9 [Terriglobia bacterium]